MLSVLNFCNAFALFCRLAIIKSLSIRLSNRPKSPKPRSNNSFQPEPTIRTEDNASLLQQDGASPNSGLQNAFFGQFRGFTLTPLKNAADQKSPIRSPPPVPAVPTIPTVQIKSPVKLNRAASNSTAKNNFLNRAPSSAANKPNSVINAVNTMTDASVAPALPPLNPGAHPRPLISSPVLENSTCTAKELISPLRNAPKIPLRPAPEAPVPLHEIKRPLSSPNAITNSTAIAIPEEVKKPKENISTLNRIASFLKSADKKPVVNNVNTSTLPKTKPKNLDKGALRNVEISNPIPQKEIQIAISALPVDIEGNRAVVMRAQSMRGNNVTPRPNIQTFGSMRQPNGFKRPTSIPVGNRPKSPPPPRPPLPTDKQKGDRQYDDCLNEAPLAIITEDISPISSDNIYAVIEESPVSIKSPVKKLEAIKSNSGSSESVGLLGEIVSEIQSRNLDSIYSTSTLARKKKEAKEQKEKEAEESKKQAETYVNTSSIYKSPGSVYSNMSSTASNGYINPSSVNPPISKIPDKSITVTPTVTTENPPSAPRVAMSTFKSETPKPAANTSYKSSYTSPFQRPQGPIASTFKSDSTVAANKTVKSPPKVSTPPSPTNKTSKPLTRQVTPPSLTTTVTKQHLSRQKTPPNIRSRKPSPTRTVPPPPKSQPKTPNNPDIVTSCSNANGPKSPDIVNSGAPSKPIPKTVSKITTNNKVLKSNSDVKPPVSTKLNLGDKTVPTKVAPKLSNVASLQQKFENRPPISAKGTTKSK